MAQWYCSRGGQQSGPVTGNQIRQMAQSGELRPDDLLWREGLAEWIPARKLRELQFGGPAAAPQRVPAKEPTAVAEAAAPLAYSMPSMEAVIATPHAVEMLRQTKPWVRLCGIMMFIGAGLMALVGFIALIVVPRAAMVAGPAAVMLLFVVLIYLGMAAFIFVPAYHLNRYASVIGQLVTMRRSEDLELALESQKAFWKFVGITILVVLGLYALLFLLGLLAGLAGALR